MATTVLKTNQTCSEDRDCPTVLRCYTDVSWDSRDSFCECDLFHGFEGADCTELNPTGEFILVVSFAGLLISMGMLFLIARDVVFIHSMEGEVFRKRRINSTMISWLIAVFCQLMYVFGSIMVVAQMFQPQTIGEVVQPSEGRVEKFGRYRNAEKAFAFLLGFGLMMQAFSICVVWLEVSASVNSLLDHVEIVHLNRIKRTILVILSLYFVSALTAWILGYASIALILAIPCVIYYVGLIIWSKKKFSELLGAHTRNSEFEDILHNVRLLAWTMIGFAIAFGICISVYSVYILSDDWREFTPPGELSPIVVVGAVQNFLIFLGHCVVYVYVSRILFTPLRRKSTSSKGKTAKTSGHPELSIGTFDDVQDSTDGIIDDLHISL